uniref:BLUF domain-containing protein n=1 Tax=Pedobacter schmidteae TaxID=2201271 RepID=UPI0013CF1210|nr:BLUF domain-containing protein [Pedobacter schmidteae]
MIFYLLYWGVESHKMDDAELEGLLLQARERNLKLNITGSLFYCEGTFIQLLEGEEENVKEVFRSIGKDNRLMASKLISQGYANQRYFGDWSMHYQQVDAESIARFEGYPVAEVSSYLKNAPSIKLLKLLTRKKTNEN